MAQWLRCILSSSQVPWFGRLMNLHLVCRRESLWIECKRAQVGHLVYLTYQSPSKRWRTEVVPMPSRLALSDFRVFRCDREALGFGGLLGCGLGYAEGSPWERAWAMPALTRSLIISRSNFAKTASIPASALPVGVVMSRASVNELKPRPTPPVSST